MNNKTIRISDLKLKAAELVAVEQLGTRYQPGDRREDIFNSRALEELGGKDMTDQVVALYCNDNPFYTQDRDTGFLPIPDPSFKDLKFGDICQYQGRTMVVIERMTSGEYDEMYLLPEGLVLFHDMYTKSELLEKNREWLAEHTDEGLGQMSQCEATQAMLMKYSISSIAIEHAGRIALATTKWFSGQERCRWDLFTTLEVQGGNHISIFIRAGQIDCTK